MKRRLLATLMTMVMVMGMMSEGAQASDNPTFGTFGVDGNNLTWNFSEDTGTLVIGGNGAMEDFPWTPRPWYHYETKIKTIIISGGVTNIGCQAFYNLDRLTSITIPDSVTEIGSAAFQFCTQLTEITIPNSVDTIGNIAFGGTGITNIVIPYGVTTIQANTFSDCSELTEVMIPNTVITVESLAFSGCSNLHTITIPDSVTTIEERAFYGCSSLTNIIIPDSVGGLAENAAYLFSGCSNLTSVTLPSNLEAAPFGIFYKCSSITDLSMLPESITTIDDWAFGKCTGLTDVKIPKNVASIGVNAFRECTNLTSITIPLTVTKIDTNAFWYCDSLTDIYYEGCEDDWSAIRIATGNDSLFNATIHYNSTGLEEPDNPDTPGEVLEAKNISGVLRSGDGCRVLWQCSYQVGEDAQPKNGKIKIFTSSTDTVDEELFLYNEAAETGFPYPWELAPYNLPKSAITSIQIVGEEHKQLRVPANAFWGYSQLKQVTLDCVSAVDNSAFADCTLLQSVAFSDTVKYIGANAFQNTDLRTIQLGRNVETIGENAFAGCANLKIRGYKDSVAHQYATANGIPFEPISDEKKNIPFYSLTGNKTTELDIEWGWDLFQLPTYQYHHQLAALGMTLSAAVEEDTPARAVALYNELGFEDVKPENYGFNIFEFQHPAVVFAHHREAGKHILIITVRGTNGNEWEDIITDISPKGFINSAKNIYSQFNTFLTENGLSANMLKGRTKVLVTGHSLGGATANALTKTLNDEYGLENVFVYTFAAPRPYTVWDAEKISNVYNAFNIVNEEDIVPKLKNVWTLQRIGTDLPPFHRNTTDGFYENFKLLTGREFIEGGNNVKGDSAHDVAVYMAYVLSRANGTIKPVQFPRYIVVRIACPVDVEVYDSNQKLVGQVSNNQVVSVVPDKIQIYVEGDEKQIVLIGDDDYSFKMIGTDTGTMTYSVYHVDGTTQKINSEKIFDNVALVNGKHFTSHVSVWDKEDESINTDNKTDVPEVKLYVLDNENNPEKEVLPDGNGTEIPITKPVDPDKPDDPTPAIYTITFAPNGGSVAPVSAKTEADGKLTALPIPTRTGYSFQGWYTAISGGSVVTTDTVFAQDTTVYAHWSYNDSSGPNGGGSTDGDVTYPSGGNSSGSGVSTPNYSITAPSAPGGTVTISPKSAAKGATVTIAVKLDDGYELLSLIITDGSNKEIPLTDQGNGKYTFTMPGSKVTVNAEFQIVQPDATEPTPEVPWSNPFTDVSKESWYYDAVEFVSKNGLMNGISNDVFAPDANLSRAMLAQILYNKEGMPSVAENSAFTDVAPGEWYSNAVAWAAANNIVGGYGNGLFGPNDDITREQLAVMLWRYAGEPSATSKELHFSDANEISGYALDALKWAVENSIVNGKGDNILDPKGSATRAQVAQMFKNFLEK